MKKTTLQLSLLLLATGGIHSFGAVSTYSNRSTFDSAVGPTTVETFTPTFHFPLSSGVLNSSSTEAGLTLGEIKSGVTYSTPVGAGSFFNIDAGANYDGGFLDTIAGPKVLTVTFDNPNSAFGFDANTLMGNFDVTIFFSSGPNQTFSYLSSGSFDMDFYGFQSSSPDITGLTIAGDDGTFGFALDNFTFTDETTPPVSNVPDSGASAALLTLGMVGMATLRRRLPATR